MKKFVVAVALMASTAAFAQSSPRFYGGLELGASRLDNQTGAIANTFVSELGGAATATQDASIGIARFFLGYRLVEKLAIEGGYFSTNKANYSVAGVAGSRYSNNPYTATAAVDYSGFDLSAVWFPLAEKVGDAGLFLKAGVHHADTTAKVTITGVGGSAVIKLDDSGTGGLFGAGYDWKFTDTAFARAAFTRYLRVAGDSDNKATVWSVGVGMNF